jgi:hypothetical protein
MFCTMPNSNAAARDTTPPPPAPKTIPCPAPSDQCARCEGYGQLYVQAHCASWTEDGLDCITCPNCCGDGRAR